MYPFADIMDMRGFDAVCAFSEHFGGQTIYVPSVRSIFIGCIREEAILEREELSIHNLAKKYGITERHMYRLLG
jgi:Mor family transcriptional regulator